jgi:hypothetical protein
MRQANDPSADESEPRPIRVMSFRLDVYAPGAMSEWDLKKMVAYSTRLQARARAVAEDAIPESYMARAELLEIS